MAFGITDQELSDRIAIGMRIGGDPNDPTSGRDLTPDEQKDMDTLMKLLKEFQEFTDNPESDSSIVNLFRLLGGDPTASSKKPRTVTLPWWGHALRPVAAVRDVIAGTDNTLSEGQLTLMRQMKNQHVDIPKHISIGPRFLSTYIENFVQKNGREFLLALDSIPFLRPVSRIRQLRSFFSPVDAKFELLDMATQLNVQKYTYKSTDLAKSISKLLLKYGPEFSSAAIYHMYDNGLHSCKDITEIDVHSKRKITKALYSGQITEAPSTEETINQQKFNAVFAGAQKVYSRFYGDGDENRTGYLANDFFDATCLTNMREHYEHTMKSVILDDDFREDRLKTARTMGYGGIPKYTQMMKHIVCNTDFLIEWYEGNRNGFETDGDDASGVYEYAVHRRDDQTLTPFGRNMDQLKDYLEGLEWGGTREDFHPLRSVRSLFLRLFGVNMHTKQKRATSFFVNVGWETLNQIENNFHAWQEYRNDSISDIQGLAYWMKQIPLLLTAFEKHAGAFYEGVGESGKRGELPPSVIKRFGLPAGATGGDLVQSVMDKLHPIKYEVLRSASSMLQNVKKFDPSWNSAIDGQPFGYRVMLADGKIEWKFNECNGRSQEERQKEYQEARDAYTARIDKTLGEIYNAARTTAGYLNSTSSTYRGIAAEMKELEQSQPSNNLVPFSRKNFSGIQTRHTPSPESRGAPVTSKKGMNETGIADGPRTAPTSHLRPDGLNAEMPYLYSFRDLSEFRASLDAAYREMG
jgi:hypothetical protein